MSWRPPDEPSDLPPTRAMPAAGGPDEPTQLVDSGGAVGREADPAPGPATGLAAEEGARGLRNALIGVVVAVVVLALIAAAVFLAGDDDQDVAADNTTTTAARGENTSTTAAGPAPDSPPPTPSEAGPTPAPSTTAPRSTTTGRVTSTTGGRPTTSTTTADSRVTIVNNHPRTVEVILNGQSFRLTSGQRTGAESIPASASAGSPNDTVEIQVADDPECSVGDSSQIFEPGRSYTLTVERADGGCGQGDDDLRYRVVQA